MENRNSEALPFPRHRRGRPLTIEKRNAILAGAADVFDGTPYEDVLVDVIAARAGVGKGTLYRYFSSKEDLYVGVAVSRMGELKRRLEAALASSADLEKRLAAAGREYLAWFWNEPVFLAIERRRAAEDRKSDALLQREKQVLRALVTKAIAESEGGRGLSSSDVARRADYFFGVLRAAEENRRNGDTPESAANDAAAFVTASLGALVASTR